MHKRVFGVDSFVNIGFQLIEIFVELGYLHINEVKFVVENLAGIGLYQLHFVEVILFADVLITQTKVQKRDAINGIEVEVSLSFDGLLLNGKGAVVK